MDYRDKDGYYYSDNTNSSELRRQRSKAVRSQAKKTSVSKSETAVRSSALAKRMKKKSKKEHRKQVFKRILFYFAMFMAVCLIIFTGIFVGMYAAVKTEIKDMNIENLSLNVPSYIYYEDSDGDTKELKMLSSSNNTIWVESDEISQNMKDAIVSIEDERFYDHKGVDIKRTTGAVFKYVLAKMGIGKADYGGSTITQQTIKNITNEREFSPTRKVKEMLRAIAMEQELEKDEILTIYLNVIFFANKCYGVESAANTYYGKSAKDLTIPEAATIAGITNAPTRNNPFTNPENALARRNLILKKMYELEKITKEEYDDAIDSDLGVKKRGSNGDSDIDSYFEDQLVSDILYDLQKQYGYTEEFAKQQLFNGGLQIYATLDPDIQEDMESVFENTANFPNNSIQSAMTIIDPYTGRIKGMVGGTGKKTTAMGLNRAVHSKRQPGSSIKPLSAYAPAIDTKKLTAASVLTDEKTTLGSDDWTPSNSYKGYKGDMAMREAIGRSANTIAAQVVDKIGIGTSYKYLTDTFHLESVEANDKNYASLALGGLTKGVSVTEMSAAYAIFVNSGKYIKPHTYTKVLDNSGKVILENKETATQVLSPEAAYIMADLLLAPVNEGYGTATKAKLSGFETHGKTGTTNDNYDKWFVGFTSHYVGAVWTGYDTPKSIGGSNPSTSVWKSVMTKIHNGLSDKELKEPADIVEERICTVTGKLAKSSCPSKTELFIDGTEPRRTCSGHQIEEDEIDEDTEDEENNDEENPQTSEKPEKTQSPSSSESPSETTKPTEKPQSTQTAKPTTAPTSTPSGNDLAVKQE